MSIKLILGASILLLVSGQVNVALFDRGDGLIYDDVFAITWMQNANVASWTGVDTDGVASTLTWSDALAWSDALEFAGHSNWRLPFSLQPDPSCPRQNQYGSSGLG